MSGMERVIAYIGLGSNLGDRRKNIEAAIRALAETPGIAVVKQSTLLENPAVGGPADSPAFLNGVVAVSTTLSSPVVMLRLLEIERELGRTREIRWEPRTIDLDLLLFGSEIRNSQGLALPHPRMREREFVLRPLAEIAPEAGREVLGAAAAGLLAELSTSLAGEAPIQHSNEQTVFEHALGKLRRSSPISNAALVDAMGPLRLRSTGFLLMNLFVMIAAGSIANPACSLLILAVLHLAMELRGLLQLEARRRALACGPFMNLLTPTEASTRTRILLREAALIVVLLLNAPFWGNVMLFGGALRSDANYWWTIASASEPIPSHTRILGTFFVINTRYANGAIIYELPFAAIVVRDGVLKVEEPSYR